MQVILQLQVLVITGEEEGVVAADGGGDDLVSGELVDELGAVNVLLVAEAELALLVAAPGEDAAVLGHGERVAGERAAVHALHVHVLEERQTNVNR